MKSLQLSALALAGAASLLALVGPAPAQAAVVTYTYTGSVAGDGVDPLGLFGASGASLAGLAFSAVFTRDDSLTSAIFQGPINSYVFDVLAQSPVSATLTINGHTLAIDGANGGQSQADDGWSEAFGHQAAGVATGLDLGGYAFGQDYLAGPDYHTLTALNLTTAPNLTFFGSFIVFGANGDKTEGGLVPTGFTVASLPDPAGGVPEPASWALMIVGFGGLGAGLRARRAHPATA